MVTSNSSVSKDVLLEILTHWTRQPWHSPIKWNCNRNYWQGYKIHICTFHYLKNNPWLSQGQYISYWVYGDSKFYGGHPGFYKFRALGSLQFSLEHSLTQCMHRRSMGVPEKTHSLLLIGYGSWHWNKKFSVHKFIYFLINLFIYIFVHHRVKWNKGLIGKCTIFLKQNTNVIS